MKFRPLHDRVVVKRIDAEEKTAGGIIIPDTAKEKPPAGRGRRRRSRRPRRERQAHPIDLKVGDRVLFGKWSGTEVKIDGDELLIMKESDIMGVLVDEAGTRQEGRLSNQFYPGRRRSPALEGWDRNSSLPRPSPSGEDSTKGKTHVCQGS